MDKTVEQENSSENKKKWPLTAIALIGMLILGAVVGLLLYQELQYPEDYQPSRRSTALSQDENKRQSSVDWQSPRQIQSLDIFKPSDFGTRSEARYYKIGNIVDGEYEMSELILATAGCRGLCFYEDYYRIVKDKERLVILSKYSSEIYKDELKDSVTIDGTYSIPELDYPEEIKSKNYTLRIVTTPYVNEFFNYNGKYMVFEHEEYGPVYSDGPTWDSHEAGHGFYIPAPDGTVRTYELAVDFIDKDGVPQITWNTGKKNIDSYTIRGETGCNPSYANREYDHIRQTLEPVGTTATGQIVFSYEEKGRDHLQSFYNERYDPYELQDKLTYNQFLDDHPVFFWVDPFDRLLKFTKEKYLTYPECVI